jgi:DtxR family Mn-dependent transcriptional regulator
VTDASAASVEVSIAGRTHSLPRAAAEAIWVTA